MSTVAEEHLHTHSVPREERWVALYVMCVGMLMVVLDVILVSVALPSIRTTSIAVGITAIAIVPKRVVRHATSQ
jgi:hypothetical protein